MIPSETATKFQQEKEQTIAAIGKQHVPPRDKTEGKEEEEEEQRPHTLSKIQRQNDQPLLTVSLTRPWEFLKHCPVHSLWQWYFHSASRQTFDLPWSHRFRPLFQGPQYRSNPPKGPSFRSVYRVRTEGQRGRIREFFLRDYALEMDRPAMENW